MMYIFSLNSEKMCLILLFATHFFIASFPATECSTTQVFFNQSNKGRLYKPTAYVCTGVRRTVHFIKILTVNTPIYSHLQYSPCRCKTASLHAFTCWVKKIFLYNCYCLLLLKQQKEVKLLLSASVIFTKQKIILSGIHRERLHFIMKWDPEVN